ncbi:hypothetical protein E3O82_002532, partial [Enterococcus faecalis]|nr:hypothetical protein [Enterococcus faecalis]
MKIMHIIQMMRIGGAQQTLINIIKGTRQHEHIIYSTLNDYVDTVNVLNIRFINSSKINIYRVLQKELPDIVLFHWWPGVYEYNFKRIRKISKINFRILVTIQDPERLQDDVGDYYVFCSEFVKNQQHERIKN